VLNACDINEILSFPQTIVSNARKPVAPRRAAGEVRLRRPVIRRTAAPDAIEASCNQRESTIEIIRGLKLIKPSEAKKMLRFVVALLVLLVTLPNVWAQAVAPAPPSDAATDLAPIRLAQAQPETQAPRRSPSASLSYSAMKDKYNKWTVGLAAGLYEGAGTRMAAELAKALEDDDNMRVLPLLTKGLFGNVYDLLYLKGIDIAIVNGDILEHFKTAEETGIATQRINYIANLYVGEVHILVRPEINSIQDLAGKVVNFNVKSSATGFTGPIIFDRLGIKVIPNFDPHLKAVAEMTTSQNVAAVAFVSSKPLSQFQKTFPPGFKFIPVPYNSKLSDLYLPSDLTSKDYPGLVPEGRPVQTVAVPTVLAAYDWPKDNDRHRRMVRFIDALFDRLPVLQSTAGNHPKWKEMSLSGTVPGWKRFPPMQQKIEAAQAAANRPGGLMPVSTGDSATDADMARQVSRKMSSDPKEQERLFKDFMEWAKTRR
jgi:TRAP-type uncharacterized transport system substrate-binding protein